MPEGEMCMTKTDVREKTGLDTAIITILDPETGDPIIVDGKLKVDAEVSVPEITLADIVIKDAVTDEELVINDDGSINVAEKVVKDTFDEDDLETGVYTLVGTYAKANMGFGINNNSTTNELTFTIGTVTIAVPAGKSFYNVFVKDTTIAVISEGSLDFDAFVEG